MQYDERFGAIECILFVSGDPVPVIQLQRALGLTDIEMQSTLQSMDELYRREERGIQLYLTEETVQLVSNRKYTDLVLTLLQPVQSRTFSQSMLETLSIIAYRQPVTRADIEAVRGVRCEYAVSQLLKLGMIRELGRKDVVGRPMLFGTTDAFLRHFGLRSISELPRYEAYAEAGSGVENTEAVEQA
ncbi:MAG: SMC-Scp complex subunit ScpB [Christensenellaceae bacterium]|nr:SMC-Scp complex subunit ScpB [Christensenellaceae bacterium]MCI5915477.1 SMC-Scp complex subunit ScpB [Christensenella sp.]